ncbi:hypothetical protein MVEN_00768000 [Mycena venus]|uniref:Uncharacterized protein n=1 Tax=Mycena venus TaxID=2733690 RepID=A0A8H6YKR6_9AGAR|nr:hypothetical protein MVEN_00768000 [Mycena venus]
MNPLTRQDTRPSIHSWWSDSNPGLPGPTVNLHTMAKPLMRRMYHRQVSEFIRKNRGSPLARDVLETYSSYFPWDYVARGTKIAILSELINRTESDVEARVVVDSPVLYYIAQMLRWPDIETRSASCMLLGNLASHESTAPAVLELNLCEQLVSLVGEGDSKLTRVAQGVLCHIAQWLDGAQAIVGAPVLDHVLELLESPRWAVRDRACDLVEKLAQHDTTLPTILESKACALVVSLLVDEHPEVVQSARNASSCIAQRLEDAPAINVKTLDHVLALLESSNPEVRRWACDRVGDLAHHKSSLPAILESETCVRVVSLLGDTHPGVLLSARNASSRIAQRLEDAPAVDMMLDHILALIKSSNPEVRRWACNRLGGLAWWHKSTLSTILKSEACVCLVSLLFDTHTDIVRSALPVLTDIARKLKGAETIVKAKVLDNVLTLIESWSWGVRDQACALIEALLHHESILPAVLKSKKIAQLLSLLHNKCPEVVQSTIKALSQIAEKLDGAQAIVEAKLLDNVSELIESSCLSVQYRYWACTLIETLVHHESILPAVLESKTFTQLLSLLHNEHPEVVESATKALSQIAKKLEGAQAIVKAKALDNVSELFESSCSSVRFWTCTIIKVVVHHESILPAVLELKVFVRLLSLLHDRCPEVVQPATQALSRIAEKLEGAQAIIELKALDDISALLESLCSKVQQQTCILIRMLVHHKSILLTVLESKAFVRLLSLLHNEHPEVVQAATKAVSQIAEKLEGAQAKAKVLDNVSELIKSSCLSAPHRACTLIEVLIYHESLLPAVLELKAFAQLLSLLHDEHPEVVQLATKVVSQIAEKLEGAQAKAKVLDNVSELIKSSCLSAPHRACTLIEVVIHHESILPAVLESKAFAQLLSLLHNEHPEVVESATKALSQIAKKLEGAQAIVKAKALDNVSELFESSCSSVRFWTYTLIEALVHHESILPAVLETKACARLVAFLLREAKTSTYPIFARSALREISEWPVGAAALMDMPDIFEGLLELCQSSDYANQRVARSVLDNLAHARSKQQIP